MEGVRDILIVIVGGDPLAVRVCEELMGHAGQRVTLVWRPESSLCADVERLGATFSPIAENESDALVAAGILGAAVVIALTDDDHLNLRFALSARDLNSSIRVVLRQFNRTLGRMIEDNLPNCAVISLSSVSAATYASAAVDPSCYHGVQFPDIDGPLVGFMRRSALDAGVSGRDIREAETLLTARILARNGRIDFPRDAALGPDDIISYFALVRPAASQAAAVRARAPGRAWWLPKALAFLSGLDPLARGAIAAAVVVLLCGTMYFTFALGLDPFTAAYFVIATMTTTGYGDISPEHAGLWGEGVAIVLMLAGLVFSGIFIAVLSSRFTQAQYVAVEGLRRLKTRGHIVVCGAGNVGSRVIDFLLRLGCRIVVIETKPTQDIVQRARRGKIELLTGDATKESTLELCNLDEALALVAITSADTTNLEVALGARARVPNLSIVMRVQHESFEKSVRNHFDFDLTFGTAALAAPVLAGLARSPGVRGRIMIGELEFAIVDHDLDEIAQLPALDFLPLAVWRDGAVVMLGRFEDARPLERILLLFPSWRVRRDAGQATGVAVAQTVSP